MIKRYLKALILSAVCLYIATKLVPTIDFGSDPKNILLSVAGIFVISQLINPLFSIILMPINHLTFGLVMLVLNIALIFGLIRFLPGFAVEPYYFSGANINGVILPALNFNSVGTIILVSLIISFSYKILHLVFE